MTHNSRHIRIRQPKQVKLGRSFGKLDQSLPSPTAANTRPIPNSSGRYHLDLVTETKYEVVQYVLKTEETVHN
jgi:hypothetical protein